MNCPKISGEEYKIYFYSHFDLFWGKNAPILRSGCWSYLWTYELSWLYRIEPIGDNFFYVKNILGHLRRYLVNGKNWLYTNWNNVKGNVFDKVQCTFQIPVNSFYLISQYETGQYGHETFDFIILRNEDKDILQTGKKIPEVKISKIYLQADTNITVIINTDSAAMYLTMIPEYPCNITVNSTVINPCINAECSPNLNKEHRFECICNNGYRHVTDMHYICEGKFINLKSFNSESYFEPILQHC